MKNKLDGDNRVLFSRNVGGLFDGLKNKFILLSAIIVFLIAILFIGNYLRNQYIKTHYAFKIGGNYYSRSYVDSTIKYPLSTGENKDESIKNLINILKVIYYFKSSGYLIDQNLEQGEIKSLMAANNLSISNEWINVSAKYNVIIDMIDSNMNIGNNYKGELFIVYYLNNSILNNPSVIGSKDDAHSDLIKVYNYAKKNGLDKTETDYYNGNLSDLMFPVQFNKFGNSSNSWEYDIQDINIIDNIKKSKNGLSDIKVGQIYNDNKMVDAFYYFYNLDTLGKESISRTDLLNRANNLKVTRYEY